MDTSQTLGALNGHIVGRILKEGVRRAMVVARNERLIFEATAKQGYDGSGAMDDVFTSADTKAQAIIVRTIEECFPNAGIIGEEGLRIEPKNGCTAYFTIDPIDGTRAYIRRQSDGISVMVALVDHQEVLAAYVCDINTEEVYGYRPGSDKVFRITRLDTFEELHYDARTQVKDSYVMLRDPLDTYSEASRDLAKCFKNHEVRGSSIGTWAAQLWKGEKAALLLPPGYETPWDSSPVVGISLKLGYAFYRPVRVGVWVRYEPLISSDKYRREHETLIIHPNAVLQLQERFRTLK